MSLVDIVDKNDNIIGRATRAEAHEKGLCHRVAAVFVFDDNGNLLVQERKKDGLLDHSVGGHVELGETYDVAAARELGKELGLKRDDILKIGTFYSDERTEFRKQPTIHYFGLYETTLGQDKLIINKEEVVNITPISIQKITEQMKVNPLRFTPGFMKTLNFYIEKKGLAIPPIKVL